MRRVVLILGSGLLALTACSAHSAPVNWYSTGRNFVIRDSKVDVSTLRGEPGIVQSWCSQVLMTGKAPVPSDVPAGKHSSAAHEWLRGCVAEEAPRAVVASPQVVSAWYAKGEAFAQANYVSGSETPANYAVPETGNAGQNWAAGCTAAAAAKP
jgi:hypothetical protein